MAWASCLASGVDHFLPSTSSSTSVTSSRRRVVVEKFRWRKPEHEMAAAAPSLELDPACKLWIEPNELSEALETKHFGCFAPQRALLSARDAVDLMLYNWAADITCACSGKKQFRFSGVQSNLKSLRLVCYTSSGGELLVIGPLSKLMRRHLISLTRSGPLTLRFTAETTWHIVRYWHTLSFI